jgi:hypothetical protein
MMRLIVPVYVQHPAVPDGRGSLSVQGQMYEEMKRATSEAGNTTGIPEGGAIIDLTRQQDRPSKRSGYNPQHIFSCIYTRPGGAANGHAQQQAPQGLAQAVAPELAAMAQQQGAVLAAAGAPAGPGAPAGYQPPAPQGPPQQQFQGAGFGYAQQPPAQDYPQQQAPPAPQGQYQPQAPVQAGFVPQVQYPQQQAPQGPPPGQYPQQQAPQQFQGAPQGPPQGQYPQQAAQQFQGPPQGQYPQQGPPPPAAPAGLDQSEQQILQTLLSNQQ